MQKRLISMVLALSMALTAMPLPALAQSAPPDTAKAARWAVEAELLPDMGEGAFTPGKRVTKVQVIRAWLIRQWQTLRIRRMHFVPRD